MNQAHPVIRYTGLSAYVQAYAKASYAYPVLSLFVVTVTPAVTEPTAPVTEPTEPERFPVTLPVILTVVAALLPAMNMPPAEPAAMSGTRPRILPAVPAP